MTNIGWYGLGVAALCVAILNLATNRHSRNPDGVGCAVVLLLVWVVTNWISQWFAPPENRLFNFVLDLSFIGWISLTLIDHGSRWKLWLLMLLGVQLLAHLVYQLNYLAPDVLWRYTLMLNITYAAQLVAVGWSGGAYATHHLLDHLHRHRPAGHHVGVR